MDGLSNKVDKLEVHEPSEKFLKAPNVTPEAPPAISPDVNYQAERLQDMVEAFFALRLLLGDLHKIRESLRRAWTGYQIVIFDLVAVSLMTNAAVDIARRMEEEIRPILDAAGGSEEIFQIHIFAVYTLHGKNIVNRELQDDEMKFCIYDVADTTFELAHTLLNVFRDSFKDPHNTPLLKYSVFDHYDPSRDRSKMSPREKYGEDKVLLAECFTDLLILNRAKPVSPEEDEFMRGMRAMFDTGKIPIWLVFATQIFLDIHHELRQDVERGYHDLYQSVQIIRKSVESTLKCHLSQGNTGSMLDKEWFQDILDKTDLWPCKDYIQEAKDHLKSSHGGNHSNS